MILKDEYGNDYNICADNFVGIGGQGCVFSVVNNGRIVIKAKIDSFNNILQNPEKYDLYKEKINGIRTKATFNNLAVPLCMLEKPFCGYVMRFMEDMVKIEDIMVPGKENLSEYYVRTGGLKRRYFLLRGIAKVLNDLYKNGLVYADLSPKNVFISKKENDFETWLIDVDNLQYEGEEKHIIGTQYYRAPEIFKEESSNTLKSDVYSFALLAFELLTLGKPFDGGAYDEQNDEDDWGENNESCGNFFVKTERGEIPYVGSEKDKTNPATSGMPIDDVMTPKIKALFVQTLEDGRNDPAKRPSMAKWLDALNEACDWLVMNKCGHYNLKRKCFLCGKNNTSVIRADGYRIVNFYQDDDKYILKNVKEYSVRFRTDMGNEIKLPNYLFLGDGVDQIGVYDFSLIRSRDRDDNNKFKFRLDERRSVDFKIPDDEKAFIENLDKHVMNLFDGNEVVRKIEFNEEK